MSRANPSAHAQRSIGVSTESLKRGNVSEGESGRSAKMSAIHPRSRVHENRPGTRLTSTGSEERSARWEQELHCHAQRGSGGGAGQSIAAA